MKTHNTFKLSLLAASLAGIYGSAIAQESDEIRQLATPESSISIGGGHLSQDRRALGKYDGMAEAGFYGSIDADLRQRNDQTGTWSTVTARDLGLSTPEVGIGIEQQGKWGVSLGKSRIVSNNPNLFITGVNGIGTNELAYGQPATTAAAAQANLFPATTEVRLGTDRDITTINTFFNPTRDLQVAVNFRQDDKSGTRHWGRGSNVEFAVEPIDSTTRALETILNYSAEQFQVSGGYSLSTYENRNSFVDTIGGSQLLPAGTGAAAPTAAQLANTPNGHTVLSLPNDNYAHQFFVNGGLNFTPTTRATLKASFTSARQNESLGPIRNTLTAAGATGNNTYLPVTGAADSLDGRVDTTLLELALSAKPIDKLSLVAQARYQDRDDKTPRGNFGSFWTFRCTGVAPFSTTNFFSGNAPTNANCNALSAGSTLSATPTRTEVGNDPRSFKNLAGKLEGTYRLPHGYSVTGGVNYDQRERGYDIDPATGLYEGVVKIRGRNDETSYGLQVRKAWSALLNGSLSVSTADRTGSAFQLAEGGSITVPVINHTNPAPFADRKRDKARLALDFTPVEMVQLQFIYETTRDRYGDTLSGLKDGSTELFSLDAMVTLGDNWKMNAWVANDTSKWHQVGYTYSTRTTPSTTSTTNWQCTSVPGAAVNSGCTTDLIWDAQLKDTGNAVGLGITGSPLAKLTVGGDVQWAENKATYPISSNVPTLVNTSATAGINSKQALPDIKTTTTRVGLFGQYALDKQSDVRLDVVFSESKSDDWTTMVWDSTGTNLIPFTYMDGTQVVSPGNQSSTFIGARYMFRFQ